MKPVTDERGVTTPINYLLLVGIVALLSAGLLANTSFFVETQQEQTIRSELRVIGNRLAADLASTDRLAQTVEGSGNVETRINLPSRVAGSTYRIEISVAGSDAYVITLTSTEPEIAVTVRVRSRTAIATGALDGDDLTVTYDPSGSGKLEVANA